MARIAWTEQFSVGVPQIDRQHQRLLDLLNGLEERLAQGTASRNVRGLFAELASYTKYHFTTEANVLRRDSCPTLRTHLQAHDVFIARLAELEPLLAREGAEAAAREANQFLRSWILRHIVVVDRLALAGHRTRPTAPDGDAAQAAPNDARSQAEPA